MVDSRELAFKKKTKKNKKTVNGKVIYRSLFSAPLATNIFQLSENTAMSYYTGY